MDANRQLISVAGAATLLLRISVASCRCDYSDYMYTFQAGEQKVTVWGKATSWGQAEENLRPGNEYSVS